MDKNLTDQKDYVYCTCVSFDNNDRCMKCDYEKPINHHGKVVKMTMVLEITHKKQSNKKLKLLRQPNYLMICVF